MKKKTLLGVAAAAAVGAAGWYLAAGGRKNQIEHIRREAKRLLAVRRDELAALRSAAEAGELDAGALGPVPLDGTALESVRMEDGAAVLSLRGEKAAAWLSSEPLDRLGVYSVPWRGSGPACSTPNIWAPDGTRATPAWGGADMLRIREAIVVEGRYDKNTLSQMVDTVIVETSGFGIFKDKERLALLRRLAEKRGLIVLTDPDGAGFVIRSHLKGSIPPEQVKHAYVPDVYGKERRKRQGGKEGKLGVEGMRPEVLEAALRRAGATFLDETGEAAPKRQAITKADLMALGLSGGPGAAERRKELLHRLELPERLSPNALLEVLNALFALGELEDTVRGADAKKFS